MSNKFIKEFLAADDQDTEKADKFCKEYNDSPENRDAKREGEFWASWGYGIANLFGFGQLVESKAPTALDKLKSTIQDLQTKNQETVNTMSYYSITAQSSYNELANSTFVAVKEYLEDEMKFNNEILNDEIQMNSIYIGYVFILVIITIIFLYFIL